MLQTMLPHKRAMLYFTQPSTRTFLSFNNACHVLGIRTSEIRDPSTSSEVKGESFEDSIRTFSSYVDIIIMRTWSEGMAKTSAQLMDRIRRRIPIVNAGSGKDQHPTQALLDIYTLERSFENRGGIDGKTIGLMGDLKRGRTARSLAYLMQLYRDVRLVFIAPEAFQIDDDIKAHLEANGIRYQLTDSLHEVLPDLDAIYVTRLQTEYDEGSESGSFDHARFRFGSDELALLKPEGTIMHPLPRGPELDPAVDVDPRAVYWRQERNGMWMRVALLMKIFGVESEVDFG
jgi:aspartate carbamoyltransferase catalytic subunit